MSLFVSLVGVLLLASLLGLGGALVRAYLEAALAEEAGGALEGPARSLAETHPAAAVAG